MNPTGKLFFDNEGPIDIYVETITTCCGEPTRFECVSTGRYVPYSSARSHTNKVASLGSWNTSGIKEVIFNPPATIVFWNDGTKTVVKCQNDEVFDAEKGLAMAISKKYFGNKGSYCNQIKKWTEKYEDEQKASTVLSKDTVKRSIELGRRLKEEYDRGRIRRAYSTLVAALHKKRPRKDDLTAAMEEAIGYLGEVLDD